jgi:polyisoprenyl-phosphate glycosyltransferase
MSALPRVSVAVPLFNEEHVLPELLRRISNVVDELPGGPHEIVVVNDGSSDGTFDRLAQMAADDGRVVVVSLSRNFGHQAALSAALDYATGDVVVVMDGDLQDPPEVIPHLLEEHSKGFDVVYVRRVQRKEGWILRACYFVFYRMLALVAAVRLPVDAGDFALLSRRVVDALKQIPEHQRYLRGLRTWVGFRQTGVAVERAARHAGRSKYSTWRLVKLALDGLMSFSMAPLRAAAALGLLVIGSSTLFAVYAVYVRLVGGRTPEGFTMLIVVMTFMSGVQLLFLGVIGEYLGRVYDEVKGRPQYFVDRVVRAPTSPAVHGS